MPEDMTDAQRSRDADALHAAYGSEGCPICLVVLQYVELAMDAWEFEGFTDMEHRHQLIRSRGFCPLHTWQLARRQNAFRLGLIYSEVLTDVLQALDADYTDASPPRHGSIWNAAWRKRQHQADVRPTFDDCPFCQSRASSEERLIATLAQLLDAEEERALLSRSTGLCLTHFALAQQFAEKQHPTNVPHLLACQRTCLQRVLDEVRELVRKHDYRFGSEPHGEEMLSWRRAAELCSGNPGVW